MLPTPEVQAKIARVRAKIEAKEPVDIEEYKDVVKIIREGRMQAVATSDSAKRKKAIAAIPDANNLLDELNDI